jgi:hypothetical protein
VNDELGRKWWWPNVVLENQKGFRKMKSKCRLQQPAGGRQEPVDSPVTGSHAK